MNEFTDRESTELIDRAIAGDQAALESLLLSIQDLVFSLSLRMLGTFADAEDATQDILLKVVTHLSTFRRESSFSTWVFSIASNHLKNYKKHLFAQFPLSFEYYGDDIKNGTIQDLPDLTQRVDRDLLAEELKLSCTNVMLQCLDPESRCIFVLGTMFRIDSRIAGEVLGMTPEAYRQRLSRTRRRMADFLEEYCGEYGRGQCRCRDRLNYAIHSRRLNPRRLEHTAAVRIPAQTLLTVKQAMEELDDLSQCFSFCSACKAPERTKHFIQTLLDSAPLSAVTDP